MHPRDIIMLCSETTGAMFRNNSRIVMYNYIIIYNNVIII